MRMKMDSNISPSPTPLDNAATLLSLIALFYTQGNTSVANQLLKTFHGKNK